MFAAIPQRNCPTVFPLCLQQRKCPQHLFCVLVHEKSFTNPHASTCICCCIDLCLIFSIALVTTLFHLKHFILSAVSVALFALSPFSTHPSSCSCCCILPATSVVFSFCCTLPCICLLHSSCCTLLLLHSSCQRFCCILPVILFNPHCLLSLLGKISRCDNQNRVPQPGIPSAMNPFLHFPLKNNRCRFLQRPRLFPRVHFPATINHLPVLLQSFPHLQIMSFSSHQFCVACRRVFPLSDANFCNSFLLCSCREECSS